MSKKQSFIGYLEAFFVEIYDAYAKIDTDIKNKNSLSSAAKDFFANYFRKNATDRFLGEGNAETAGCFRGVVALSIFFSPHYANAPDPLLHKATRFIEFFGDDRESARLLIRNFGDQLAFRFEKAIGELAELQGLKDFALFLICAIDDSIIASARNFNNFNGREKQNILHKFALPPEDHAIYKKFKGILVGDSEDFTAHEIIHKSDIQVMDNSEFPVYNKSNVVPNNSLLSCFFSYQPITKHIPNQQIQSVTDAVDDVRVLLGYQAN